MPNTELLFLFQRKSKSQLLVQSVRKSSKTILSFDSCHQECGKVAGMDSKAAYELALLRNESRESDELQTFKLDVMGGTS
jgi:hypothetical protein